MTAEAPDRLEGELLRFVFRADEGAFAVARVRDALGAEHVAVGPLGHVVEGQHVSLRGRWTTHPAYGRRFRAEGVLVDDPRTLEGIERYLSSGAVHGLGPTFARRVVERFGLDTLRVLEEEPERLREVPGIGPKRLAEIVRHWERDRAHREVHATLRGYGIGPALAAAIVDRYGKDALAVVRRTPYRLAVDLPRVGFRTADAIARDQGLPADAPERAEAAVSHLLRQAEGEGHCFLPRSELLERARDLDVPAERVDAAVDALVLRGEVVAHPAADPLLRPVQRAALDRAEAVVADVLRRLAERAEPEVAADAPELGAEQRAAVALALRSGACVITGGPGTGKTTTVRALLRLAEARGERWLLAAPTGRAAKRLAEQTGAEARTVHRLLEYDGRRRRFTRNAERPLEADAVLVDEASMVDTWLAASLLSALPPRCRLVLVGDADQLPSVGPGRVLRDVIESGRVPVATLRTVYRQAAGSDIVRAAHAVLRGALPRSAGDARDFFVVHRADPLDARDTLLEVVARRLPRLGFDPLRDVQVLSPMRSGPLGTRELNRRLGELLNPRAARGGPRGLAVGDRVIQVRNDYDHDVFNGDIGRVVAASATGVVVDFDGREVAVSGARLDDIEPAWAITVHKSQGSEYPAVVIALHRAHHVMLRRNLLYTAITRARRFCCIVGDRRSVWTAVQRTGGDERWTRLRDRLA